MDIKTQKINEIITKLSCSTNNQKILSQLEDILVETLYDCDLTKKCTDLSTQQDDTNYIMKNYVASKRVEGLSENTIHRYYEENIKLINFLNKPIKEITTNDIRFYLSKKKRVDCVSNRTLDGMRRCFSALFSWLQKNGYISENPCATLTQITLCLHKYKR